MTGKGNVLEMAEAVGESLHFASGFLRGLFGFKISNQTKTRGNAAWQRLTTWGFSLSQGTVFSSSFVTFSGRFYALLGLLELNPGTEMGHRRWQRDRLVQEYGTAEGSMRPLAFPVKPTNLSPF